MSRDTGSADISLIEQDLEAWIHQLLTDPVYLDLKHKHASASSNLFSIVAASHKELWHSAFLKWILSPNEGIGLGTYPLECFLRALRLTSASRNSDCMDEVTFEWIETSACLFVFKCEAKPIGLTSKRNGGGRASIDVLGIAQDPKTEEILGRIVIENKINSKETGDQTKAYYEWANAIPDNAVDVFVFLTPRENDQPKDKHFIVLTYQQLFADVLQPISLHPQLGDEPKLLIEHYILNLALTTTKDKPMANTYENTCRELYRTHQEIFDLIFRVVRGDTPTGNPSRKNQSYGVRVTDVTQSGHRLVLILQSGKSAFARVREDGLVDVEEWPKLEAVSISKAATVLLGRQANGWKEWSCLMSDGSCLSLLDLRADFLQNEFNENEN